MAHAHRKVLKFPLERRRAIRLCPHCGRQSDVWRIGRLLWGFCDRHELRWVVADFRSAVPLTANSAETRQRLERLSAFAEITT